MGWWNTKAKLSLLYGNCKTFNYSIDSFVRIYQVLFKSVSVSVQAAAASVYLLKSQLIMQFAIHDGWIKIYIFNIHLINVLM